MRKRKIMTVAGVLALTVSSMAGCKGSDVKETTTVAVTTGTQEEYTTTAPGDKNVETTVNVIDETTADTAPATTEVPTQNEWDDPHSFGDHIVGPTGAGDEGVANTSGISEFIYGTSAPLGYSHYKITFDDVPKVEIRSKAFQNDIFGIVELDAETVSKIEILYEKYKMWRWDGYDRYPAVTDGVTKSLRIRFRDGQEISAKGYMVVPKGFGLFSEELNMILQPYIEQAKTTPPEVKNIRKDDEYIDYIKSACEDILPGSYNFEKCDGQAKIIVDPTGVVKILGFEDPVLTEQLNTMFVDYLGETYHSFASDSYNEGSATIIEFAWNPETAKWDVKITNQNPGSMYCK
ncbi:MAG: hypothetical protein J6T47_08090 [Lachnospiraceae bacterium]|nr:hypothetical protein [Lachnospiraceae bacterium]